MNSLSSMPTLRDARHDDVPAIVGLLADDELGRTRENWSDTIDPAYFTAFDQIEGDPGNRLIVADVHGEVVGCMQITMIPHLTFTGGRRLQIEGVRVKAPYRGRRIGEAMIAWAIDRGRENGCHLVQLTSNRTREDAGRFYERLGFEPTHIGYKLHLS